MADRRKELAAIHAGAKALGLERDTYEAMLWSVARVRSAGDLSFEGRQQVIAHLRARGAFKGHRGGGDGEWAWVDRASEDRRPLLRKIIMQLKAAGRAKAYAEGIAGRMFHVKKLEFCSPDQLHAIVTALARDANRKGRAHER